MEKINNSCSEQEQLRKELKQIFISCPCDQNGKATKENLCKQIATKFGGEIIECLNSFEKSLEPTSESLSLEEFTNMMTTIVFPPVRSDVKAVDYISSEIIETDDGNTPEGGNYYNCDMLNSSKTHDCSADLAYWKMAKEATEEKLIIAETTLSQQDDRILSINRTNMKLSKDIEQLKEDLLRFNSTEEKCVRLKEELKKIQVQNEHVNNCLRKSNVKIETLEMDTVSKSSEIDKLKICLTRKSQLLTQTDDENQWLCLEVNHLKEENESLLKKLNMESIEKANLLESLNELSSENKDLQLRLSDMSVSDVKDINLDDSDEESNPSPPSSVSIFIDNSGISLQDELINSFNIPKNINAFSTGEKLKDELLKVEKECYELNKELKKINDQNHEVKNDLRESNLKIETLEEDAVAQSSEIKRLQFCLAKISNLLSQTDNQNKVLFLEVNKLREEKESLFKKWRMDSVEKEDLLKRIHSLNIPKNINALTGENSGNWNKSIEYTEISILTEDIRNNRSSWKIIKLCVFLILIVILLIYGCLTALCINKSYSCEDCNMQCFLPSSIFECGLKHFISNRLTFKLTYPKGPPPS